MPAFSLFSGDLPKTIMNLEDQVIATVHSALTDAIKAKLTAAYNSRLQRAKRRLEDLEANGEVSNSGQKNK